MSLVSCSVSYPHWLSLEEQAASITCPYSREQKWWKLRPGARGQSQEDMELFPKCLHFSHQSQPMSQDHPLRWLQRNQRQERASPPEWFGAIKSGTN